MRMAGLEPARCHHRQILSLLRLPFRHIRTTMILYHSHPNIASIFMYFFNFFITIYKNIYKLNSLPFANDITNRPNITYIYTILHIFLQSLTMKNLFSLLCQQFYSIHACYYNIHFLHN